MNRPDLVSVIIPHYNQGQFLGEAIGSVLNQSYRNREIIVVDDGSADDVSQVVSRYPGVRLIRQRNAGLSAARNAGLEASAGQYLVFLDADDRLLPVALETGVDCLKAHPACAFVYGHYRLITADGAAMPSPPGRRVQAEHYLSMLRSNYIGMHAAVMYRRTVFDAVGGFNISLAACEDYDLYLRITRSFPIYCHAKVVAEYRQHGANMSCNAGLMLKSSLCALGRQWRYVRADKEARQAYAEGRKNWQEYYGKSLIRVVRSQAKAGELGKVIQGAFTLLRYHPRGVASKAAKKITRLATRGPKLISAIMSR